MTVADVKPSPGSVDCGTTPAHVHEVGPAPLMASPKLQNLAPKICEKQLCFY